MMSSDEPAHPVLAQFEHEGRELAAAIAAATSDRARHAAITRCEAHDRRLLRALQHLTVDDACTRDQRREFARHARNLAEALCDPAYGDSL